MYRDLLFAAALWLIVIVVISFIMLVVLDASAR